MNDEWRFVFVVVGQGHHLPRGQPHSPNQKYKGVVHPWFTTIKFRASGFGHSLRNAISNSLFIVSVTVCGLEITFGWWLGGIRVWLVACDGQDQNWDSPQRPGPKLGLVAASPSSDFDTSRNSPNFMSPLATLITLSPTPLLFNPQLFYVTVMLRNLLKENAWWRLLWKRKS